MTKSREVEVVLVNKGFERGTVLLLTELFEHIATLKQQVLDTNKIQLNVINSLSAVTDSAGRMRLEIERMQRISQEDDTLPPRAS